MVTNNTTILESILSQGGSDESPGYKQYSYIREPTEPKVELIEYQQYIYIREPTEPRWS